MPPICLHPLGYHDRNDRYDCSYASSASNSATNNNSPDSAKYEIEEALQLGKNLVLKVRYPNCASCAYEGVKVLVYLNITPLQAIKWKKIDPHFKDPKNKVDANEAPAPAARFPASPDGWMDAQNYAGKK